MWFTYLMAWWRHNCEASPVNKVYFNTTWATKMLNKHTPGTASCIILLQPPHTLSSKTPPPCDKQTIAVYILRIISRTALTSWSWKEILKTSVLQTEPGYRITAFSSANVINVGLFEWFMVTSLITIFIKLLASALVSLCTAQLHGIKRN